MRVRMAFEEKGIAYQVIEEDLGNPSAELLRIHPSGQVPVLVHGDQVIPESAIITEYVEEIFPNPPLLPADPAGRARVRLWTHWCAETLKGDLDEFKYDWETLNEDERAALLARLHAALEKLAAALSDQPFLLGESITLADIHLFPFYRQLTRARPKEPELLSYPASLNAWLERLVSRPSFVRVMARPSSSG